MTFLELRGKAGGAYVTQSLLLLMPERILDCHGQMVVFIVAPDDLFIERRRFCLGRGCIFVKTMSCRLLSNGVVVAHFETVMAVASSVCIVRHFCFPADGRWPVPCTSSYQRWYLHKPLLYSVFCNSMTCSDNLCNTQ